MCISQVTVNVIGLFLVHMFEKGYAYSTLNSIRSALSFFIGKNVNIGSDDSLSRLFKYFFKTRPSLPRYLVTWDINKLLTFLMHWHPSNEISLEKLTLKTVSLVAVTSSDRAQTLESIDVNHSSFHDDGVRFPIYSLLKTTKQNQPVKVVHCIRSKEPTLDVCEYVSTYMTRSYKFRIRAVDKGLPKPKQLFLSYATGKPIKRATIAKYITKTMELAGIDVSCFKAHTTRGIIPSIMSTQGCSAHQIMQQGSWSNVTTFEKHYGRVPENSPAGVLIQEVIGRRKN